MSDASVRAALRSDERLVVIEAPAGCGKTHQGAEYASEIARAVDGRLLILTHTHAACSVFAERTRDVGARVEVRTIDAKSLGRITPASVFRRIQRHGPVEPRMAIRASQ